MKTLNTKKLATLAMLSALSFLIALPFHFIKIPLVPDAPHLLFEPKDIVIAVAGFIFGPLVLIPMSAAVAIMEMTLSGTGIFGIIMNVASTLAFTLPAALIYKAWRTITGAVIGLCIGAAMTAAVMVPLNYLITPAFTGYPVELVAALLKPIAIFNITKYALVAAMTMLVYKSLKASLIKARLIPEEVIPKNREDSDKTGAPTKTFDYNKTVWIISVLVIIVCIFGILYLNGVF
ncbi:MAG: ECF transporter S component [Oscillospiraceae bacterium]|nr:ECF transporter S component [Oscillospiraceae bacterium]